MGDWWYKRMHWEAAALGNALYLAAGAAGPEAGVDLKATGIGSFYGPWTHAWLQVDALKWADVYHITVGWPKYFRSIDATHPYHHTDVIRPDALDWTDLSNQGGRGTGVMVLVVLAAIV